MKVTGSVGLTSKSRVDIRRVNTNAIGSANGESDRDERHAFTQHHAKQIRALGAESHADAQLLRSTRDRGCEDAGDAQGREQQRQGREGCDQHSIEALRTRMIDARPGRASERTSPAVMDP